MSVSDWVNKKGLTFPSTHYRSFRRWVFPVNHLHWYWQPNKNNQYTNNNNTTQKVALGTTDTLNKPRVRDRTDKAWFSRLYDIRPGKGAGLFLQPRRPYGAIMMRGMAEQPRRRISVMSANSQTQIKLVKYSHQRWWTWYRSPMCEKYAATASSFARLCFKPRTLKSHELI